MNHPVQTPITAECQLTPSNPLPMQKSGCCGPELPHCEGLVLDNAPWRYTYKTYVHDLPAGVPVEAWIWNRYPYPGYLCTTDCSKKYEKKSGCCIKSKGCC